MNTKDKQIRIVIVEDEILVARELEARLGGMGYSVEGIASSAEEGLQMVDEKRPDLVLMDIVLKGPVDGITVAGQLRERFDIPSIYVTAYCDERTLSRAKETEPYGYIVKPFAESELRATLEIALHKRQTDLRLERAHDDLKDLARELRLKNQQLEEELKIAHDMQMAMLPSVFPSLPSHASESESALEFHSLYTPSGQISGDFFDVLPLSESKVGVFICDVMGHNVSAALVTAMIRALVEELGAREEGGDPGALLSRINHLLLKMFEHNQALIFATAFYLVADVERGELVYANAAHPSPLYLSADLGDARPLQSNGDTSPAMGLFGHTEYRSTRRSISQGDRVLLFTDGIFEVENRCEEAFSQERLVEAVRQRARMPCVRLFRELVDQVRSFSEGLQFPDDVCLLGMEIKRCGALQRA